MVLNLCRIKIFENNSRKGKREENKNDFSPHLVNLAVHLKCLNFILYLPFKYVKHEFPNRF